MLCQLARVFVQHLCGDLKEYRSGPHPRPVVNRRQRRLVLGQLARHQSEPIVKKTQRRQRLRQLTPKHVYRHMSRAASREEASLVSLRELARVYVRLHGWLLMGGNVGRR